MDLQKEIASRLRFGLDMYQEAKQHILRFYQQHDLEVEKKSDASPVTEADRGAELLMRNRLSEEFASDGVLGEEFGEKPGGSGFRWILDPVDGTKSFIHGVPLFGTLIGIEHEPSKRCVAGICGFPALDEVVYASQGQGAWWKIHNQPPRKAQVSSRNDLHDSTFCITNLARWERMGHRHALDTLLAQCGLIRGWGDCFGHILVATGRIELMIDPILNPWDGAALFPILEEAGGHFVDWKGNPTIYGGSGISVNSALKDQVLRIVQGGF